jgi:multidrug efflux pump subunit AcrA (membrane-fusion protein)
MTSWTKDDLARLDGLRGRELAGALTEAEGNELAALMAQADAELARLLAQQQSLAADGRRFLAEFDERRAAILGALARLANGASRPG